MTSAWIFTGGTDCGVMSLTGRILRDVSQLDSTASEQDQYSSVKCIGILPYGILSETKVKQTKRDNKVSLKLAGVKQQPNSLEPNHTHFLLVDDGSVDKYHVETSFRHALEEYILNNMLINGKIFF